MWEDGSYVLNGVLDAVGGAAVRTALEPLARKSGEGDTRERDRRLADALVELAEGSMQRPQIQVTSSVETLLGLSGAPAAEMDFSLPSPPRNHGAGTPVGRSDSRVTAA